MKKIITLLALLISVSVFSQNELLYYAFNGNAIDSSSNHRDATVYGATLTTDRFGNTNSAYSFDGNDSIVVSVPMLWHDTLDLLGLNGAMSTGQATISFWFKVDNMYSDTNTIFTLAYDNDEFNGSLYCYVMNNTLYLKDYQNIDLQLNFTLIDWHNVVITFTQPFIYPYETNLYLDDTTNVGIGSEIFGGNFHNLYIGSFYNTENFNGSIDDFRIIDTLFSQSQVDSLYVSLVTQPPTTITDLDSSISIFATGVDTYTWQLDDGSKGWVDLTNNSTYSGVYTNTLNFDNMNWTMDGYKYRCKMNSIDGTFYSDETTLIFTTTSINENNLLLRLLVYPNPANESLYVNSISENSIINIYDETGNLVISQKATKGVNRININSLRNSLYYLKIGGLTEKIILTR